MTNGNAWAQTIASCRDRYRGWQFQSEWLEVTQRSVNLYAESVFDPDPMHIDADWARANTPFGGTIAQGLWTTSILVRVLHESGLPNDLFEALDAPVGLNYGWDRLRLIEPVPTGCSIRGHLAFDGLDAKDDRTALLRIKASVVTNRAPRPAVAGDWILAFRKLDQRAG